MPQLLQPMFEALEMDITDATTMDIESIKPLIENKDIELLVAFPTDFDSAMANYDI